MCPAFSWHRVCEFATSLDGVEERSKLKPRGWVIWPDILLDSRRCKDVFSGWLASVAGGDVDKQRCCACVCYE
ncbi:hypothetical protein R5R35_007586 [Gryllus longicercus]|uniref:Uncharacterized protein n=1 Tax=Gryllus longicercus TaxID=2509291 RepID=A0AAN9W3G9_9ORTH